MRVVVEASAGPRKGARWLLRPGEQLTFGRMEQSDITIGEDASLSSRHFRVTVDGAACLVEDLSSTNGTWIDGSKIATVNMADGGELKAGKSTFVFQIDARDVYKRTTDDAQAKLNDSRRLRELEQQKRELEQQERELEQRESAPDLPEVRTAPIAVDKSQSDDPNDAGTLDSVPTAANLVSVKPTKPQNRANAPLELQVQQCASGLWLATQVSSDYPVANVFAEMTSKTPVAFIIDSGRTGLDLRPECKGESSYVLTNIPPDIAVHVSPRLLSPSSSEELEQWMADGWGHNGMIALITQVPASPLLEHFQSMIYPGSADSMVGLCWPNVLEGLLANGEPKFVQAVVEPIDAFIIDSRNSPGGWALIGDQRLLELIHRSGLAVKLD